MFIKSAVLTVFLAPISAFAQLEDPSIPLGLEATQAPALKVEKPKKESSGKKSGAAEVERALAAYRKAAAVQARLKKTVSNEIMGNSDVSEGRFYFSKGRLRMDIEKPEKSLLVYDGKSIWLESHLDDQHIQVSRLKSGPLKRTDSLMAALFDKKDVLKQFRLIKSGKDGDRRVYAFEPKEKKKTEVRFLEVALLETDIQRITYKDQMENSVTFEFSDIRQDQVPSEKFAYKPPKNASVNEL